jgi:hypothetical protein
MKISPIIISAFACIQPALAFAPVSNLKIGYEKAIVLTNGPSSFLDSRLFMATDVSPFIS